MAVRTDDLIDQLAADPRAIPAGAVQRRFVGVAVAGALAALALLLVWLGTRHDLAQAMTGRMVWMKATYTALLGVAGFWALERLARPEGVPKKALLFGALVLALFVGMGFGQWLAADWEHRRMMMRGHSWTVCARNILMLALPGLAACLLVLQYDVHPFVGLSFGPITFLICVLGGLGNFVGGFVAAFVFAEIISLGGLFSDLEWGYVLAFAFFILMMFIRPAGLLARRQ